MTDLIHALYVDDEPDLLKIGKIYLEHSGDISLTTVTGAAEAIELLKTSSFDVIISDYQMPRIDGITFLKQLKAQGDITPFILFTGRGREEVVIEALNNGADFYLQKGGDPRVQFTELLSNIRHTVSRRRAEKQLLESQKRVADIIDFLPDATFAIDTEGVVIAWNKAMEEMTGIRKEEMIGQGDHMYTIPFYGERRLQLLDLIDQDRPDIASKYLSFERKGHNLYAEFYSSTIFDGKGAYMWATVAPLFDVQGNRVGAIESIRDITERQQNEKELLKKNYELQAAYEEIAGSEAELRANLNKLISQEEQICESEEKYKTLFESSGNGIFIMDHQGFLDCNKKIEEIFHTTRDQIIGHSPTDFSSIYQPDGKYSIDKMHEKIDAAFSGEPQFFEWEHYHTDGTKFIVEVTLNRFMMRGSAYLQAIVQDITDRKKAEDALYESEERLLMAQKISNSGSWEFNTNTGTIWGSAEALSIYGLPPIAGELPIDEIESYVEDREVVRQAFEDFLSGKSEYNLYITINPADGSARKIVHSIARLEKNDAGDILRVVGVLQDVTELKQAESVLQEINEAFVQAQKIARVGSWTFDIATDHITWSDELYRIFGYEPGGVELGLNTIRTIIHPDDIKKYDRILKTAIDTHVYEPAEYRVIHPDGSLHYVKGRGSVDVNEKGSVFRVIGVIQDITELKHAESVLQEINEAFVQAQKIARVGSWTFDFRTNRITWSDELYRIFGYEPGDIELNLNTIRTIFHPDDLEMHDRILNAAIERHFYERAEYRVIYPDSSLHYIDANGAVEVDDHGDLVRIIGVCQDITWRKTAELERENLIEKLEENNAKLNGAYDDLSSTEEELRHQYHALSLTEETLRQTKEFLENLISIANVPIIVWDPAFRVTRLNHAFELLIGRSAEEVVGKSLEFLFPPDQAERSMRLFHTTLDGIRWETTEIDIIHQDGSLRTLLWSSATMYDHNGRTPIATIAQGHDVTEERRLEKEKDAALAQIQQNLAYLSVLNDEIRNPLTIIISYVDTLTDPQMNNKIVEQVHRIDRIVNQLDRRWIESEKVLNAIRKHYQIHLPQSDRENK